LANVRPQVNWFSDTSVKRKSRSPVKFSRFSKRLPGACDSVACAMRRPWQKE
jgi:hypothetical protein